MYAAELAFNLAWSFVFFAGRMIGAAFADVLLLLAAVVVSVEMFRRIDRLAAWLLVLMRSGSRSQAFSSSHRGG